MKGCRPLTDEEIHLVTTCLLGGRYGLRNVALFTLGLLTGFRISELLSLKVKDVMPYPGVLSDRVTVDRRHMKKKRASRSVPFHPQAQEAIRAWIESMNLGPEEFLFRSRKFGQALTRIQAWRIYKRAFRHLLMTGKVATHSTRKTIVMKLWVLFDKDILKLQSAMGWARLDTAKEYIDFLLSEVDDAFLRL